MTYNSSAGSGKTFTLVKEYLKIALETDNPNTYRHILAITFTNKAAAEMKDRVLGALIALSSDKELEGTPKFLLEELLKPKTDGGLGETKETIAKRSENVLKSILHNYNDFGISTIDKFTHKIIRTFAHDLQLPLNFNIELDEEDVLKASIDMLITEVGNNEKLTKLLIEYALHKSDDEKSWSVERDLLDFSKKLLREDGGLYLEKVRALTIADFEQIKEQLYQQVKSFEAKVKQMAEEALSFIDGKGIHQDSFSRSFYPSYWNKIIDKGDLLPTPTALKIINGEANWYAAKVDANQKQLIDENVDELIRHFNESREYIEQFEGDYIINKKLIVNLYNIAVLNEIEKTLLEFKHENNILNISDFNKRIAAIVASEPVPFIYERLGEKYQHYLIDEFQDTSIVQWHNLLPLVDNSLANGKFNMVVGDAKQAIYRWRGGEVEQLLNFPKLYRHNNNPILLEREQSIERNFEKEELQNNFRSKAEIVDFNNQFFQTVANNLSDDYKSLYSDLNQGFNANNTGGGVNVSIIQESDNQIYNELNLNQIFKLIENCIKDGYEWKDIAILTRGNEEGKQIAAFLLEQNIQVISSESLLLNHSAEVQFILSVLQFLTNPNDLNFEVQVLNYLTQHVHKIDLFEVYQQYPKNTLLKFLNENGTEINYQQISNYDLYELVEYLMVTFSLDKTIDIYLQFFLDKIHEYTSKNDHSILNFLEWWDSKSKKFSIVIPEGSEAVQVMTIHKSKGLEFPVVIYPFADSIVKRSEDFFWTDETNIDPLNAAIVPIAEDLKQTKFAEVYEKEMEKSRLDLINLLYVAFTRSKDRLYVIAKKGKDQSKHGSVGDYLYDFCSTQPQFDVEQMTYTFGEFAKHIKVKEEQSKSYKFKQVDYNNWRDKIKISFQAPKVWEVENPETIGEYGTLIHNILSQIETPEQVDEVLNSFVLKGMITEYELSEIKKPINSLFAEPAIKDLFVDYEELKNERSILTKSGKMYQPDRVVVKNGVTHLVDYKTGERKQEHIEQILDYRNLLTDMGYQNIKAQLLYLKEDILEEV